MYCMCLCVCVCVRWHACACVWKRIACCLFQWRQCKESSHPLERHDQFLGWQLTLPLWRRWRMAVSLSVLISVRAADRVLWPSSSSQPLCSSPQGSLHHQTAVGQGRGDGAWSPNRPGEPVLHLLLPQSQHYLICIYAYRDCMPVCTWMHILYIHTYVHYM